MRSLGVVELDMTMEPWLLYILICLATHRATRFFTRDHFPLVAIPRERITNWWDPSPDWRAKHENARPHWGLLGRALAFLWECDWCLSMYVGAGIIWGVTQYVSVPLPVLAWLMASTVTGLIATNEPD